MNTNIIENLLIESLSAGDYDQAAICRRALAGDADAIDICADVVDCAAAMES